MEAAAAASGVGDSGVFLAIAPFYFAFTYFFLFWDSRRADSPTKDDGQILLKTVLCFIIIVGVGIAAGGLVTLMHYLLSGAKTGTPELKKGLAGLIAGAIPFLTAVFALLPRTNHKQHAKAVRFMFGFLGAAGAFTGFMALKGVIENLIMSAGWPATRRSGDLPRHDRHRPVQRVPPGRDEQLDGAGSPGRADAAAAQPGLPAAGRLRAAGRLSPTGLRRWIRCAPPGRRLSPAGWWLSPAGRRLSSGRRLSAPLARQPGSRVPDRRRRGCSEREPDHQMAIPARF